MRSNRSSGLPTHVRLIERVGKGSFGEVWLARDTSVGRDVAVKFLDSGSVGIAGERFEREARSLARLKGIVGVVPIRDLGLAADGTPWLVTDFLPGNSLRFQLELSAPEPFSGQAFEQACVLLKQLAGTLSEVHEIGVLHGDISPSNVLFDEAGRACLADFGLADIADHGSVRTQGGGGLTPAYAAPERLRGARPSPQSDVYSLAATTWHLLAGEPRPGKSEARQESAPHLESEFEPELERLPGSRRGEEESLVELLSAAMAAGPSLRPSAADLVESLTHRDSGSRRWRYRRADGKR